MSEKREGAEPSWIEERETNRKIPFRFRNDLPDPSAKMKLLPLKKDPDRYCRYQTTSLEKNWKPVLYVEPDLGIPLDLLDMSVYNRPEGELPVLDPEDEELLRSDDDDAITTMKADDIKKKERPTDNSIPWLIKTQYISPLSMNLTKQSLSERQSQDLQTDNTQMLLNHDNIRERKIQTIIDTFEARKSEPVHAFNHQLKPKRVLPLFPYFDRYDDEFVVANFESAPTADSETYSELNASDRIKLESRAIMKSYRVSGTNKEETNNFLAYMVPSIDELEKGICDENEDMSYSWVRNYHCEVQTEDYPETYLLLFGETEARYLPLSKNLIFKKERKSSKGLGHFPVPKKVTVRRRSAIISLPKQGDM